jgi:hypothetical protein
MRRDPGPCRRLGADIAEKESFEGNAALWRVEDATHKVSAAPFLPCFSPCAQHFALNARHASERAFERSR